MDVWSSSSEEGEEEEEEEEGMEEEDRVFRLRLRAWKLPFESELVGDFSSLDEEVGQT